MPINISPNNLIGIYEENSWAIQTSLTSALAFPALAEQWWSLNVTDLLGSPENERKGVLRYQLTSASYRHTSYATMIYEYL